MLLLPLLVFGRTPRTHRIYSTKYTLDGVERQGQVDLEFETMKNGKEKINNKKLVKVNDHESSGDVEDLVPCQALSNRIDIFRGPATGCRVLFSCAGNKGIQGRYNCLVDKKMGIKHCRTIGIHGLVELCNEDLNPIPGTKFSGESDLVPVPDLPEGLSAYKASVSVGDSKKRAIAIHVDPLHKRPFPFEYVGAEEISEQRLRSGAAVTLKEEARHSLCKVRVFYKNKNAPDDFLLCAMHSDKKKTRYLTYCGYTALYDKETFAWCSDERLGFYPDESTSVAQDSDEEDCAGDMEGVAPNAGEQEGTGYAETLSPSPDNEVDHDTTMDEAQDEAQDADQDCFEDTTMDEASDADQENCDDDDTDMIDALVGSDQVQGAGYTVHLRSARTSTSLSFASLYIDPGDSRTLLRGLKGTPNKDALKHPNCGQLQQGLMRNPGPNDCQVAVGCMDGSQPTYRVCRLQKKPGAQEGDPDVLEAHRCQSLKIPGLPWCNFGAPDFKDTGFVESVGKPIRLDSVFPETS